MLVIPQPFGGLVIPRARGREVDPATVLLLHLDGTDGATLFPDSALGGNAPHSFSAAGNAQIDTAQSVFGGASLLLDGSGDWISAADSVDWDFGTGDFTIECWVRFASIPGSQSLLSNYQGPSAGWTLRTEAVNNTLRLMYGDSVLLAGSWAPSINTWYHVAAARASGTLRLFVGGTEIASGSNSGNFAGSNSGLFIGRTGAGSNTAHLDGWIDEVRISKGVARYTGNFTVPGAPFTPFV